MSSQLTTGPVKETPREEPKPRPQRKVETYDGAPPVGQRGTHIRFAIPNRKCGIEENGRKCQLPLYAERLMKEVFEDESGYGGQLQYLEKSMRYYIRCADHGPNPIDGGESVKKVKHVRPQNETESW
jgi:hypothetical protein